MLSPLLVFGPSAGAASNPCGQRFFKELDPNLKGKSNGITSPRFMRRMWIHDGYLLVLIQQGGHEGRFLSLYSMPDTGVGERQFVDNVAGTADPDAYLSGDGFLLPGGDLLLVVSSRQRLFVADVRFYRYNYRGGGMWSVDPGSPVTVIPSTSVFRQALRLINVLRIKSAGVRRMVARLSQVLDARVRRNCSKHFNATLTRDSMGRLFVSYVKIDAHGNFAVRYSYSTDGGLNWVEARKAFTMSDQNRHKSARMAAVKVGGRDAVAIVYYDHDESGEYLRWDHRLDAEPSPEAGWALDATTGRIRSMPENASASMYLHWSLARDGQGRLHLSWQEPNGIHYSSHDGDPTVGWKPPTFLVDGIYSNLTTSVGGSESFIYAFADHRDALVGAAYDPRGEEWTPFYQIGAPGRGIHRRVSSPEQFTGGAGARLPVLYQNENDPPAPATQLLLSVLLDCR